MLNFIYNCYTFVKWWAFTLNLTTLLEIIFFQQKLEKESSINILWKWIKLLKRLKMLKDATKVENFKGITLSVMYIN